MTGTISPVVERSPTVAGSAGASPSDARQRSRQPTGAFDAHVEEIRATVGADIFLGARVEELALRRLGIDQTDAAATILAGLGGIGVRLLIPVVATAVAGQWAGVPWERWAAIAIVLGSTDAWSVWRHTAPGSPPRSIRPGARRMVRDFTALVSTIVHESDVRELAQFARRWYRLRVSGVVAATVALTILLACLLAAPASLAALPIGSLALLALLLYDFGELTFQNLYAVRFMGHEAQFDHDLFWPSPVDSLEVQDEMRVWATMQFMVGIGVTVSLVFALVLVSVDSPLVVPLAAGFVVWGYITTIFAVVGVRSSVRTIVTRIRDRNLAVLQRRIDAYGPRFADLSARETDEVEHLIMLHTTLRDAPTSPGTSQTFVRAIAALVIPTAVFVVTVFGEVIAERFLDALLP